MHYELSADHERILAPLQQFSHMKIDTSQESAMPVLYVAMATWIPKCNMYQESNEYVETSVLLFNRLMFWNMYFYILYTFMLLLKVSTFFHFLQTFFITCVSKPPLRKNPKQWLHKYKRFLDYCIEVFGFQGCWNF